MEWKAIEGTNGEYKTGLRVGREAFCRSRSKRVVATHIETGERIVFESILAARNGIGTRHVQEVLRGVRRQAKGYMFRLEGAED